MTERALPGNVRLLIQGSLPNIDALELLVLLVRDPVRRWTIGELAQRLAGSGVTEPVLRDYLAGFRSQGLLAEAAPGSYVYRPATELITASVAGLILAYDKRPVTLIRTVYEIADAKRIQAFADAFRIKKKDE